MFDIVAALFFRVPVVAMGVRRLTCSSRRWLGVCLLGMGVLAGPGFAVPTSGDTLAQGKDPKRAIRRHDKNGDGKISRGEWRRAPSVFDEIDTDGDGFLTHGELKARFAGREGGTGKNGDDRAREGPLLDGQTTSSVLDEGTLCAIGRGWGCDIKLAIKRGLFETGLRPRFPENVECRDIDEQWAISYTWKRERENYHGGIDIPAPWGTPIIAAAAGTVVGKYVGKNSFRGKEIILRHSPEDTGIPLWIYTQYAHFDEMPKHGVGQRVRMGEVLGPTGNSGRGRRANEQSTKRRPALHFAAWFSTSDKYVARRHKVIPVEGRWMDPNALFRKKLPLDSYSVRALPEAEKTVPISVMVDDGEVIPANAKTVWPYACTRR